MHQISGSGKIISWNQVYSNWKEQAVTEEMGIQDGQLINGQDLVQADSGRKSQKSEPKFIKKEF